MLQHEDVVTFFHEFGHALHHILSETELCSQAGTNVARDFVEVPSQLFEEFAWDKTALQSFAKHHQTNQPLPDELHAAMVAARSFGKGIDTTMQLFYAALDQNYHTLPSGFDTTQVMQQLHAEYLPFSYVEGTHFQGTFGHLIGYDAGYYGYQWALAIAKDCLTRFHTEGLFNPKTAQDYRQSILAPGGSQPETELVQNFLTRPSNLEAYKKFLAS